MHFIAAVLLLCSAVAAIRSNMSPSICVVQILVATFVSYSLLRHIPVNLSEYQTCQSVRLKIVEM